MLKIFNSLSHAVENFDPLRADEVRIYTCGPTVYDHVQLGNLRTFIFDDALRRALKANGYKVMHVMNITDVDDKTIRRSRERYPAETPKDALANLTRHYEQLFYDDAKSVGIDFSETKMVKATENVDDMRRLILKIPNKYVSNDGIYFDLAKYPDYGVLVKLDRSHQHHRVNNDEYDKEHAADFALWKKQDGNEPAWDFDLDGQNIKGRPGWHIECSAMSTKYLGQPFDIHTGGADLIFPHHENEIAQSQAAAGKPLAKYFVHGEHLLADGRKMSKSLNNFYTLADIKGKGIDPLAFRLLVLQAHYRGQLNFTWGSLSAAAQALKDLQAWADLAHQIQPNENVDLINQITKAFDEDLNTPRAVALLMQATASTVPDQSLLQKIDDLFGLKLAGREAISAQQKELIKQREQAREKQDWAESDEIRTQLAQQGVLLKDTDDGPIWYRA